MNVWVVKTVGPISGIHCANERESGPGPCIPECSPGIPTSHPEEPRIAYCYAHCVAQRVEKRDNMAYVSTTQEESFVTDRSIQAHNSRQRAREACPPFRTIADRELAKQRFRKTLQAVLEHIESLE